MKAGTEISVKEALTDLLYSDDNVLYAIVFGSFAMGREGRESDLDIAIFFRNPPEGMEFLLYMQELSEKAGRDVHLTVLNNASALLRHQVMKYGKVLLIKDRHEYIRFRERTITDYQEYKYISGMNQYDR